MKLIMTLCICLFLPMSLIAQIIRSCYNTGTVSATTETGGIVGLVSSLPIIESKTTFYLSSVTYSNSLGTLKDPQSLKTTTSLLNAGQSGIPWKEDLQSNNEGWPILSWQIFNITHFPYENSEQNKLYYSTQNKNLCVESGLNGIVHIYNMCANIVSVYTINQNKECIDLSMLPSGGYIAKLYVQNKNYSLKFIK